MMVLHPMWMRSGALGWAKKMMDGLVKSVSRLPKGKPFCVAVRNPAENLQAERARLKMMNNFIAAGVPVFRNVERACRVLYKVTGYYRAVEGMQTSEAEVDQVAERCCAG
jgi:hypothetical protein